MSASKLESWAYLNRVVEGPNRHLLAHLGAGRDADELARGIRTRASWLGELGPATESRYTWDRPAEDLEEAAQHGYSLITPEDPEWPADEIAASFGSALSKQERGLGPAADEEPLPPEGYPPHSLWARGNTNLAQLFAQSVGIVGTRAASAYGHHATADLCTGLARHRYTIVSGGALGIDTVAHETALNNQALTVVVAACGPGQIYPKRNGKLFDRIAAEGGAIVTEYPPGMTPDRHRFLTRNRLVAALTQGSIVVEAAFRSGALNTLKWVKTYNRIPLAVPGPILGPGSLGTNLAIRNDRADMVLSADDAHQQLGAIGSTDADGQLEIDFEADAIQKLSRNELRVYDSLPVAGAGGIDVEAVAQASGFTIALAVHLLMDLHKKGLVVRKGKMWERSES
ncbi:DNA-protecting protein DprA [Corynebacterium sp. CCUG 65737]|uniref:DNA-processing protein DprA n=1 Tax=Corynebacterium sp. CCUG 65737 TaxID=2823889 RepID=UPI002108687D|nr:DNA-processing protein DprA [Corynebacterium sp. CCUG 65737]MCQ4626698.1 DNA-protecting protein DprA [Corynebacterium sp. CCUG 65737]